MQIGQILKIVLITVCVFFLGLQVFNLELHAGAMRALMVLLLTVLYCVNVKPKRLLFFLFLISFALAELVNFSSWFIVIDYSSNPDYFYYLTNGLFILSYIFLIMRVVKDMNVKQVFSKFWIHLIILIVLDVFCVIIVSGTTEKLLSQQEYAMEFIYNSIIMLLLTVAMINYMSKNTQKSMNLLLGSIFIFFSEVIQLTYFYISTLNILNVMCSLFLVLAFLFFYLQARIPVETTEEQGVRGDLKV